MEKVATKHPQWEGRLGVKAGLTGYRGSLLSKLICLGAELGVIV